MDVESISLEERLLMETRSKKKKKTVTELKRTNKNRPREMSSKIPPKEIKKKKILHRDPRFDNLCGDFDEKIFNENYSFLDKIKAKEEKTMQNKLKKLKNGEEREKVLSVLKKMKDRKLEKERLDKKKEKESQEKKIVKEAILEGKKARFKNKNEKKVAELIEKYDELQAKGTLQNYMKKKIKKQGKSWN